MAVVIDGKRCEYEGTETLLDVARANGILVPTLCARKPFKAHASCRMCCVEILEDPQGNVLPQPKIVCACETPASAAGAVRTRSERIDAYRKITLGLLASRAGSEAEAWVSGMQALLECGPMENFDLSAGPRMGASGCVMCGLCVRACQLTGKRALAFLGTSTQRHVAKPIYHGVTPCDGCGLCERVCPTGAIARIPSVEFETSSAAGAAEG